MIALLVILICFTVVVAGSCTIKVSGQDGWSCAIAAASLIGWIVAFVSLIRIMAKL